MAEMYTTIAHASYRRVSIVHVMKYDIEASLPRDVQLEYIQACALVQMLLIWDDPGTTSTVRLAVPLRTPGRFGARS